jgi:PAS domain S-box-containing protein
LLKEKSLFSYIVREDRDVLFLHLRRLFKSRGKEKCELRLKSTTDKIIHVQVESSFGMDPDEKMSATTSVTDISERIIAQKALERSEEKFRTLAENAPDIIFRYDRNFRHLYVNSRAEDVLGKSKKNITGRTIWELGYPEDLVAFWHEKIHEVFSKSEKMTVEFVVPTPSGEIYFESSLVPELNDCGDVVSVMGISRDITHFKNAGEISDLNARLEKKAQDLTEINQELESFTYAVSHNLRAPIRSIKGFAEALREDFSQGWPDEARSYLWRINRAAGRMTQLIDSLLVLSRVGREEFKAGWVDLTGIAREFSSELKNSQPERKVEFMIEEGLKIRGDHNLMRIGVQNLLRNAWKFTRDRSPARIEFGVQNEKEKKIFFVKDNGVGFDMSYAHKLFVPFQRLHSLSDFSGAGVGLAPVKRIIRKHKGKIWAEAEEGKGATFYFTTQVEGK